MGAGVGTAGPAAEGLSRVCLGTRRGRGHAAPIHGIDCRCPGGRRSRHLPISVPLRGSGAPESRSPCRAPSHGADRRRRGSRCRAGPSARGGREVPRRAHDLQRGRQEYGLPVEGLGFSRLSPPRTQTSREISGPSTSATVRVPMLFLQGTRDALADLGLMKNVCRRLGERATLVVVEDADHSFNVPKRSGRSHEEIMGDLAQSVAEWATRVT